MTHVDVSPSRAEQRKEWGHIAVRKDPYLNLVTEWAKERDITRAEMFERLVTTYAAMLSHKVIG